MGVLRYLLVIVVVGVLAVLTVAEHVERTQLGYELRRLEREKIRQTEEEKSARLVYEQAVVPERLGQRAVALNVATEAEILALTSGGGIR